MSMTLEQMRAEGRARPPLGAGEGSAKEWQPSQSAREGYRQTCDAVTATGETNSKGGAVNVDDD